MLDPYAGRHVRLLTGTQLMYGEQTLAQVASQSQQIVDRLGGLPVTVTWVPVLTGPDSIHQAILDANDDPFCVGVIAWMHTFSPAKMWIRGLDALTKPMLHLHTQANETLPWSSLDMDFMNLNQSAHGDREFGYIQTRLRLARTTIAGHVNDPHTQARIANWTRVATGVHAMRTTRLARFGDNMRGVAVTEGDKVEAEMHFGTSVNTYAVNDLAAIVDEVSPAEIDDLVTAYLDQYMLADELHPGAERHDALRYAARLEAGLRTFLDQGEFTAFTTNFEDLGQLRQLPGLAVQRLMADGYGFGGEGDWKTAMLLRTFKVIGHGLAGGTSFMEDYTYHYGPGPQRILGAHMLEVCPSITVARPSLEIHPLSIGGREDPVRLKFSADPGPAVITGIADLGGRFRLTANVVDVVEPDHDLPQLPVACAVWAPHPSLSTSAECWLASGGPHHTVLSTALTADMVRTFAATTRTELVMIDQATTVGSVEDQLRWNYAYYKLTDR